MFVHHSSSCPTALGFPYPEEGVQGAVFHELSDDHHRCALGDHALQVDDVGMVELAHDGGLAQKVPALLLGIARLEGLDGHKDLSLARQLQVATAHLTKLPWDRRTEKGRMSLSRWKRPPPSLSPLPLGAAGAFSSSMVS